MSTQSLGSIEYVKKSIELNRHIWKDKDAKNIYNSSTDAECAIKSEGEDLYIVFKYSDKHKDWEYNYKFFPKKINLDSNSCFKSVRIHRGHYLQYISILKEVKDEIFRLMSKNKYKNLIFTGFSLGGSLCQIASWDFFTSQDTYFDEQFSKKSTFTIDEGEIYRIDKLNPFYAYETHCYSFGSSNPGNKEFSRQFNKIHNVERIVYNRDPIPILPPRFFGYSRTKNPILIRPNKEGYTFTKKNRSIFESGSILFKMATKKVFKTKADDKSDHSLKKIEIAYKTNF